MMAMFRSFVSGTQQKHQQQQHSLGATAAPGDSIESQYSCPICLEVYHKPVSIGSCGHTFVSGTQPKHQQQQHSVGAIAAPGDSIESQYSCPICLEVYHKPVSIGSCGHTFCGECLQPCLQVPSPLCPLCRMPFASKKVDKSSNMEKQLSSYKAPCRGCSKKVTLVKMRSHISSCTKVQEQMANCPKFVPVVPTSQPIPSNIPNRSTFVCPYCGARHLDQLELLKHCMENHRNDPNKVVCPVCSAMPWGDPSYKSASFLQHLLHRHKFSYDTFVGLETTGFRDSWASRCDDLRQDQQLAFVLRMHCAQHSENFKKEYP
ncbi:UNVERIFIED_CONTAM: hypothetical protein FKN15_058082 [Acipenser sinensis]